MKDAFNYVSVDLINYFTLCGVAVVHENKIATRRQDSTNNLSKLIPKILKRNMIVDMPIISPPSFAVLEYLRVNGLPRSDYRDTKRLYIIDGLRWEFKVGNRTHHLTPEECNSLRVDPRYKGVIRDIRSKSVAVERDV